MNRLRMLLSRSVALVAFMGAASLGGRSLVIAVVCLLVSAAGWVRPATVGPGHQTVWRWANVGVSLLCLGSVLYPPLTDDALTALFCWMMAFRAWTNHGPQTDIVHLVIGLLVLCYGATVSPGALTLVLCVLWVLLAAPLLLLRHLHLSTQEFESPPIEGWTGPLGAIVPLIGVLSACFLWVLPVDPAYDHTRNGSANGLIQSGALTLSDMAEVALDPGIVARMRVQDDDGNGLAGPLYLPVVRMERYQERTGRWLDAGGQRVSGHLATSTPGPDTVTQDITLEPLAGGQLLVLDQPVSIEISEPIEKDEQGRWWRKEGLGRVSYRAWSQTGVIPGDEPSASASEVSVDPRIGGLANQWIAEISAGSSNLERARHLEQRLQSRYQYTRTPNRAEQEQSVVSFLFATQRGHCTYFATSLALMLRSIGIPSRVVHGFYGGDPAVSDGMIRIRRSDAHAWVEAWVEGEWHRLDATPGNGPPLEQTPLETAGEWMTTQWLSVLFFLERTELGQLALWFKRWLIRNAISILGLGLGSLSMVWFYRRLQQWWRLRLRNARRGRVALQHDRARDLVRRRGWQIPSHLPPQQAAQWLVSRAGSLAEPLETLAWLHYRVRYGGEDDRLLESKATEALMLLRVLPRRRGA